MERTKFFLAAIALFRRIFGGFGLLVKDSFVVGCNDLVYVRHAAVAKLQGISVKNLVYAVVCRKTLVDSL